MRRANNIEIMYQLSSRRGHEERSVTTEPTLPCESFGATARLHRVGNGTEETGRHFTSRFALTPYNGACGSDFLSNLNASRSARHLKVGLKAGQQPLGVSQTLKVSIQDYTSSATARFHREDIEFADGRGNLADGSKKLTNGGVRIADGRIKWPGGANNLPMDAFKLPIVGLNCRWTHLDCQLTAQTANGKVRLPGDDSNLPVRAQLGRWEQKTARGWVKPFGEHEKWSGDGSAWPVSTSFDPGKAQTARGRVNLAGGPVNMRVLEISVSNTSRTERHLTVSQAMAIQPLGVFKTLKVSDLNETRHNIVISKRQRSERSVTTKRQTSCHFEEGRTERSVALEQQSNRFLNRSSLGMTERLATRSSLLPRESFAWGTVNPELTSHTMQSCGGNGMTDKLATCNLQHATELLTIEYNKPPSKRIAGTTKNAHLSTIETMGPGNNKLFPFFLISSTLYISSPVGEVPKGKGVMGQSLTSIKRVPMKHD